jgi:predicted Zn-dependent protease
MLIAMLERQKAWPEAENEYKALAALDPAADDPKLLLASFYQRTGRPSAAETILLDLVKGHPDKLNPRIQLAQFYAAGKQYDSMVAVLQKAIQDFPKELAPYDILARYYLTVNNSKQSIALLEQYLDKAGSAPAALKAKLLLAGILYPSGNKERAEKLVEEVIKENPQDEAAHVMKGDILADRKDYVTAIAEYRSVLKSSPNSIPVLLRLARVHSLNKEDKLAEDTYKTILNLQPKSESALFGLALLEESRKRPEQALAYYEKIRGFYPHNAGAAIGITRILEGRGEISKARVIHEEMVSRYPNSPLLVNNLAFHLAEYAPTPANLNRADKLLAPFMKTYGKNYHFADTAAWIAYRQGRYAQARELLAGLDAQTLRNPAISYHLGMVYLALGNTAEARSYLNVAAASREPFPGDREAREALKKLAP